MRRLLLELVAPALARSRAALLGTLLLLAISIAMHWLRDSKPAPKGCHCTASCTCAAPCTCKPGASCSTWCKCHKDADGKNAKTCRCWPGDCCCGADCDCCPGERCGVQCDCGKDKGKKCCPSKAKCSAAIDCDCGDCDCCGPCQQRRSK